MPGYLGLRELTEQEREELTRWAQSRTLPSGDVCRARLIPALAAGQSYSRIEEELRISRPTISRWKKRFEENGIAGLDAPHKDSKPRTATPAMQAKVLDRTTSQKPADGSTHWSWRNDPQFEAKAADIIGLYMNPPQHAAVFCVDEMTAIQALDRLDPMLPLSPGRAERHGFEYRRRGTLSLYAALDVRTGEVPGKTATRHTSAEFIEFLRQIVRSTPAGKDIHIVLENLSAHKTKTVQEFLDENPRVKFHFTPTYSSWLNQVEIWFARIERDVIARGVFTSVADLSRKLMKYIRAYAKLAKPVRWTYTDLTRRIHVIK